MRNDKKINAVRTKFGLEGYAVYCMLLESLSESALLVIQVDDELDMEMLAGDFRISRDKLDEMIAYFVKVNLIKHTNNYIYCPQLDKRHKLVFEKRKEDLEGLRRGNGVSVSETRVYDAETPQSKVKKRKDINTKKRINIVPNNGKAVVQEPLDKDLVTILKDYESLQLVNTSESFRFWDGILTIADYYFPDDASMIRWFRLQLSNIHNWQVQNPHRASRSRKGLERRINNWLSKEFMKLETTKR